MYGIFTYIWAIFGVNVGKYSIHGAYGYGLGLVVGQKLAKHTLHLHDGVRFSGRKIFSTRRWRDTIRVWATLW